MQRKSKTVLCYYAQRVGVVGTHVVGHVDKGVRHGAAHRGVVLADGRHGLERGDLEVELRRDIILSVVVVVWQC